MRPKKDDIIVVRIAEDMKRKAEKYAYIKGYSCVSDYIRRLLWRDINREMRKEIYAEKNQSENNHQNNN